MSLQIGHASIDENNRIQGGSAGDQTGREVCIRSYYVHSKGWYVLRPKSADIANKIAEAMKEACKNNNVGYDQNNRLGVIVKLRSYKTLGKIGVKTECDCSSLVRACCIQAGFDPGNFTTGNEPSVLEKSGYFETRKAVTSSTVLYNGDVLVTKTKGHTVIVVDGNPREELEVDGIWGQDTTTRLQEIFGTPVDGKISNQIKKYKDENPGLLSSTFMWKDKPNGKGSMLIKAMQKWAGMPESKRDGEIGPDTIRAIQTKLGTIVDGCVDKPSDMVKALQRWANAQ